MEVVYTAVGLVLAYLAWKLLNWAYFTPKRVEKILRRQGFKGNSYKLIYGDLKEITKATAEVRSKPMNVDDDIRPRLIPYILKTIQKHGNKSFYWRGTRAMVIITEPEVIKQIFSSKHPEFHKTQDNPKIKLYVGGILTSDEQVWAKKRKIITPAFHIDRLKLMVPAFRLSCDDFMKEIEEIAPTEGGVREVDVWPYLEKLTSDGISRTAFGSSYEEGRKIFQLQKEQAEYTFNITMFTYLPGWSLVPTKTKRRMVEINRQVRSMVLDLINKRVKAMEAGEGGSHKDLLSLLLESNFKEIQDNGNNKSSALSMDDVIEECKVFYFAGQETTSTLLVWTLVMLSRHPEWQERARDEVINVFGTGDPTYEGLSHLKIISMIMNEVLRIYTPLHTLIRRVSKDTEVAGLHLPVGSSIVIPSILMHSDPDVWGDDALEFNPERFSEGASKSHKSHGVFLPFGWGPRLCIGQNFALIEAKVALVFLVRCYSFELSPSLPSPPALSLALSTVLNCFCAPYKPFITCMSLFVDYYSLSLILS